MRIKELPLSDIHFIPSEYTDHLYHSIIRIGFSFPIKVKETGCGYLCVDGNKRLTALRDILEQNPFPWYIEFEKGPQTILPHPQYDAWRRIKSDTRYLEVPDYLKKQIEKLENTIHDYIEYRYKANVEIQTILNNSLSENGLSKCEIINIGQVLSSDILENKKNDFYNEAMMSDDNIDNDRKNIFNEVMSTNTIAKFLSMNGVGNGAVVISEKQTKARGRSGKNWESPLGGVWLSIILNPNVNHSKIPLITLATGVAVENTLKRIGVKNAEIKWPNDILIHGKKVCGILTEAITSFNTIESVIIGVGIDANISIENFPEELRENMTTLNDEIGEKVDENLLIKLFLEEFEKISEQFINEEYETILKEWRKNSYTIGKIVEVHEPFSKPYDGYVLGISRDGSLVVEKIDGTLEKVISGECIIKK